MAQHECGGLEATTAKLARDMWYQEHRKYPGVTDAETFLELVRECRKALLGQGTAAILTRKRGTP